MALHGNLRIGDLDTRITVEQKSETTNGIGEIVYTWTTLSTLWAKAINPVSSNQQNEDQEADRSTSISRKTFMVRYNTSVNETMRIYDGLYYWYISRVTQSTRQNHTLLHSERRD